MRSHSETTEMYAPACMASEVAIESFSTSVTSRQKAAVVPDVRQRTHSVSCVHPMGGNSIDPVNLHTEMAPLVRRLLRQYGGAVESRQDLEGEINCRFFQLLQEYDPERGVPLRPYLVRQLTYFAYTYSRRKWRIEKMETTFEMDLSGRDSLTPSFDPTPDWDADLDRQQLASSLPDAIQLLPERQRKVVVWRYYDNRSFEDIAQLMGIEACSVRSLLRFALGNLRKHLGTGIFPTA